MIYHISLHLSINSIYIHYPKKPRQHIMIQKQTQKLSVCLIKHTYFKTKKR